MRVREIEQLGKGREAEKTEELYHEGKIKLQPKGKKNNNNKYKKKTRKKGKGNATNKNN